MDKSNYYRDYMREKRKARKAAGQCIECGNPQDRQGTLCTACCDKRKQLVKSGKRNTQDSPRQKERRRQRRLARIANGLCDRCDRPAMPGYRRCEYHRTTMNQRRRQIANKPLLAKRERDARRKRKLDAIQHFGGKCEWCGETDPDCLTIDHIANDGKEHRIQLKKAGCSIYTWLKRNNYKTNGLRLLCYSCNLGRAHAQDPKAFEARRRKLALTSA